MVNKNKRAFWPENNGQTPTIEIKLPNKDRERIKGKNPIWKVFKNE